MSAGTGMILATNMTTNHQSQQLTGRLSAAIFDTHTAHFLPVTMETAMICRDSTSVRTRKAEGFRDTNKRPQRLY